MRPDTTHLTTTFRIWYMTNAPRSKIRVDPIHGPKPRSKDSDTLLQTRVWS